MAYAAAAYHIKKTAGWVFFYGMQVRIDVISKGQHCQRLDVYYILVLFLRFGYPASAHLSLQKNVIYGH